MSPADLAAVESRIRAFEARMGVQAVAAVAERSDHYHGLRWRAFAAGASLAAVGVVAGDLLRPDWTSAHASLVTAVTILAVGLACALLATFSRAFARLFLQHERAEAEARARAKALFLERALFATPERTAVLLFASRYERVAVVVGDRGYDGRVSEVEWESIVAAMTAHFRHGNAAAAFAAGLDALGALLAEKGLRGDGTARNVLPDRPLELDGGDRSCATLRVRRSSPPRCCCSRRCRRPPSMSRTSRAGSSTTPRSSNRLRASELWRSRRYTRTRPLTRSPCLRSPRSAAKASRSSRPACSKRGSSDKGARTTACWLSSLRRIARCASKSATASKER